MTASGAGLYSARVGQDSSFTIDTMGKPSSDLDVVVTGPSDGVPPFEAIPVRCYQQKDGRLLADFRTTSAGVHKVEVLQAGKHIRGSPFECRSYNPGKTNARTFEDRPLSLKCRQMRSTCWTCRDL